MGSYSGVCVCVYASIVCWPKQSPINAGRRVLMRYCLVYYCPVSARTPTTEGWFCARTHSVSFYLCLRCLTKTYYIDKSALPVLAGNNSSAVATLNKWSVCTERLSVRNQSFATLWFINPGHLKQQQSMVTLLHCKLSQVDGFKRKKNPLRERYSDAESYKVWESSAAKQALFLADAWLH